MNKVNYDVIMQKELEKLKSLGVKQKLLLHSCCAPCSTTCIERLKEYFDLTVYYYNPNIDGEEEYNKRAEEQKRLCDILGVGYIIEKYSPDEFYHAVKGYEQESEGGSRCKICFHLRLDKTARFAKENGYKYFATTLTVSPLKNAKLINDVGEEVGKKANINYLQTDFKKRSGYLRSIELSKEYELYRQNYCGCKFSKEKKPID